MASTDIDRWVGTVLGLGGILIATIAALIGVIAAGAEVFGADRKAVVYLAATALPWLLLGAYFAWWGNRIREGRWWLWNWP